jgi:hypothetical protein
MATVQVRYIVRDVDAAVHGRDEQALGAIVGAIEDAGGRAPDPAARRAGGRRAHRAVPSVRHVGLDHRPDRGRVGRRGDV